jgi:hypothetical protein
MPGIPYFYGARKTVADALSVMVRSKAKVVTGKSG